MGGGSSRLDIIDGCLCLRRDNDASAKRRGVDPVVCSAAPASRHSASAVEGPGGGATSRRGFHALISDATLNQQMERLEIIQKDLLKRRRDGYVEVRATGLPSLRRRRLGRPSLTCAARLCVTQSLAKLCMLLLS